MMNNIEKTKKLIVVINNIHLQFSTDYFETGKIEKVNLSKTKAPLSHILKYRLTLHESINDYLLLHNLSNITYYYRVKTSESILDKIDRYTNNKNKYPINNWMNDIFGARMIIEKPEMEEIIENLEEWKQDFGLKNWYIRNKPDYKGLHIYFKNKSNFYFPWELQLWDRCDISKNIESHRLNKRNFVD